MNRRRLLQSFAAVVVARPVAAGAAMASPAAQAQAPAFGGAEVAALRAIADVVLPRSLGADGRDAAVTAFVAWHRNYRESADRGHGYGSSTLSSPTGPPPARRYPPQFAALEAAARDRGAASFAALPRDARQAVVEAALDAPQRVTRLPARPTGANLVADFMGLFFNGAAAWDLCYDADIGRDRCRSLDGSDRRPAPLGGRR
jgi:hypothetical protein